MHVICAGQLDGGRIGQATFIVGMRAHRLLRCEGPACRKLFHAVGHGHFRKMSRTNLPSCTRRILSRTWCCETWCGICVLPCLACNSIVVFWCSALCKPSGTMHAEHACAHSWPPCATEIDCKVRFTIAQSTHVLARTRLTQLAKLPRPVYNLACQIDVQCLR